MILRTVLERVTRHWVLRRRLPRVVGGGTLYVSPSAGLRYLRPSTGSADPGLLSLAAEFVRPGSVVWDIGANVGLFSFSAAFLAGSGGHVLSVEADAWLVELLRRSACAQAAGVAPVEVVPAAAGGTLDLRSFRPALRSRSSSHLEGYGGSQTGGTAGEESVVCVTLDWLLDRRPAPDVVKIDIEGAELEALQGASRLLASIRPVLICEVSSDVAGPVAALLLDAGYDLFDGDLPASRRQPVPHASWNTLAIPKGRA